MISFEKAIETVLRYARPLPAVDTRIEEAVGRTLLEDVYSGLDMPPFDKSAVDGYAVRSADLKTGRPLRRSAVIQAGETFRGRLRAGECVKIMTGAPAPAGADAVVMVEDTAENNGMVSFTGRVAKGANIAFRGEDMKKGRKILSRGALIGVSHIAALAAAGRGSVKTGALPSVSVVNTGGEIVPPGAGLSAGRIYDSNGPMLSALLRSDNIASEPVIARDNVKELRPALARALRADIALISGGVSMGDYDLVPETLRALGVKEVFHRVRVRPGKPMFFGVKGRALVFGIPGNPVANFMAYIAYVRPAIHKMSGRKDCAPRFKTGVCAAKFEPGTPRRALVLSTARERSAYSLAAVRCNGSADIFALAGAGAFTIVKEGGFLKKGEKARFITWR